MVDIDRARTSECRGAEVDGRARYLDVAGRCAELERNPLLLRDRGLLFVSISEFKRYAVADDVVQVVGELTVDFGGRRFGQ